MNEIYNHQKEASVIFSSELREQVCAELGELARHFPSPYNIKKFHLPLVKSKHPEFLNVQHMGDFTGVQWPKAKQILRQEDQTLDQHLSKTGEGTLAFRERVINFYTSLINRHVVNPHEEMMRTASQDMLNQGLTSTHVQRAGSAYISTDSMPGSVMDIDSPPTAHSPLSAKPSIHQMKKKANPSNSSLNAQPKMKHVHVLLITHGGWINAFLRFVMDELKFRMQCDISHSFPRTSSMYRVEISKIWKKDGLDYEWEGRVKIMNDISHLSSMEKKLALLEASKNKREAAAAAAAAAAIAASSSSNASNIPTLSVDVHHHSHQQQSGNSKNLLAATQSSSKSSSASSSKSGSPRFGRKLGGGLNSMSGVLNALTSSSSNKTGGATQKRTLGW